MLTRQLQFLEIVFSEIPEEQIKTEYAIMIQNQVKELNRILYRPQKPFNA